MANGSASTRSGSTDGREPAARRVGVRCAIAAIRAYRLLLSPWIGRQCRFHPTCSVYAEEAFAVHGVLRGVWLTFVRLGKCHPFHAGGVDLVPDAQRSPDTPMSIERG